MAGLSDDEWRGLEERLEAMSTDRQKPSRTTSIRVMSVTIGYGRVTFRGLEERRQYLPLSQRQSESSHPGRIDSLCQRRNAHRNLDIGNVLVRSQSGEDAALVERERVERRIG